MSHESTVVAVVVGVLFLIIELKNATRDAITFISDLANLRFCCRNRQPTLSYSFGAVSTYLHIVWWLLYDRLGCSASVPSVRTVGPFFAHSSHIITGYNRLQLVTSIWCGACWRHFSPPYITTSALAVALLKLLYRSKSWLRWISQGAACALLQLSDSDYVWLWWWWWEYVTDDSVVWHSGCWPTSLWVAF